MESVLFERKIYTRLLDWKNNQNGKSALMIEGARRVGKSTLVEEFGKKEYRSHLLIDFMKPLPGTIEIFESYSYDIGLLTSNLSLLYGVRLYERESLVIFDEVQKYPKARELIKYLVQDGRYDYIETGSLISIKENVKNIQIPSEEESIQMNPMDFEEWLWACGDKRSMDTIRSHYDGRIPLGRVMHSVMMDKFRLYMVVGGMPGAVSAYIEKHDLSAAEKVKQQIIQLYRNDMHKNEHAPLITLRLFDTIPSRLSKRSKVFRPGSVKKGTVTDDYGEAFEWLSESKIVSMCVSNTDPNPAMNLDNDSGRLKLYMLDTGLLITHALDVGVVDKSIFAQLAKSKIGINEGMISENYVAQALTGTGHRLYFHEFYRNEDDKNLYEVDFIVVKGKKIMPVESKSSRSGRHTSLDNFMEIYKKRLDSAIVLHHKDIRIDGNVTYLPIYMASLL